MRRFDILPDPEKHFWISILKSILRIGGFVGLIYSPISGVAMLVLAEILGIVEEIV